MDKQKARLNTIHDNAERTAGLPPGDMLLARLVLNGHLYTATGPVSPQYWPGPIVPHEKEKVDDSYFITG